MSACMSWLRIPSASKAFTTRFSSSLREVVVFIVFIHPNFSAGSSGPRRLGPTKAFMLIKDTRLRRSIVKLVEEIVEND
jgi:hypothetical protein